MLGSIDSDRPWTILTSGSSPAATRAKKCIAHRYPRGDRYGFLLASM